MLEAFSAYSERNQFLFSLVPCVYDGMPTPRGLCRACSSQFCVFQGDVWLSSLPFDTVMKGSFIQALKTDLGI